MTRFLLMRHARTDWNDQRRIQGQTDTPLNETGRKQVRDWAASLTGVPFDLVLSSPLARTVETARGVNRKALPHLTDSGLMEQHWGDWQGRDVRELRGELRQEVARLEALGFAFCPPGGESRMQVVQRAQAALLRHAAAHPGKIILTVTHNGVIRSLLAHLQGLSYLPGEDLPYITYRLHTVVCQDGVLRVESINELL